MNVPTKQIQVYPLILERRFITHPTERLTFELPPHPFDTTLSNLNFRLCVGNERNQPELSNTPIINTLRTDVTIKEVKAAFPQEYLNYWDLDSAHEEGEDPFTDDSGMTTDLWRRLLTSNGRAEAYGGCCLKFANSLFKQTTLSSPDHGIIFKEEMGKWLPTMRGLLTYQDKLANMTTFYFSQQSRRSFLHYVKIEPENSEHTGEEEEVYKGFEIEVTIPFTQLANMFNPILTQTVIRNSSTPDGEPIANLDHFPNNLYKRTNLDFILYPKDEVYFLHVENSFGFNFYLNRFISENNRPLLTIRDNSVFLQIVDPVIPYSEHFLSNGDVVAFRTRSWDPMYPQIIRPRQLSVENRTVYNIGQIPIRGFGLLYTDRKLPELFFNPGIKTFQLSKGSISSAIRIPENEPLNSISQFFDAFIQAFFGSNARARVDRELFNNYFSGFVKRKHPIPTESVEDEELRTWLGFTGDSDETWYNSWDQRTSAIENKFIMPSNRNPDGDESGEYSLEFIYDYMFSRSDSSYQIPALEYSLSRTAVEAINYARSAHSLIQTTNNDLSTTQDRLDTVESTANNAYNKTQQCDEQIEFNEDAVAVLQEKLDGNRDEVTLDTPTIHTPIINGGETHSNSHINGRLENTSLTFTKDEMLATGDDEQNLLIFSGWGENEGTPGEDPDPEKPDLANNYTMSGAEFHRKMLSISPDYDPSLDKYLDVRIETHDKDIDTALTTASDADTKADEAYAKAESAETTANEALSTANETQNTVNGLNIDKLKNVTNYMSFVDDDEDSDYSELGEVRFDNVQIGNNSSLLTSEFVVTPQLHTASIEPRVGNYDVVSTDPTEYSDDVITIKRGVIEDPAFTFSSDPAIEPARFKARLETISLEEEEGDGGEIISRKTIISPDSYAVTGLSGTTESDQITPAELGERLERTHEIDELLDGRDRGVRLKYPEFIVGINDDSTRLFDYVATETEYITPKELYEKLRLFDSTGTREGNLELTAYDDGTGGKMTAIEFEGPLSGNVTGDITGNLEGNVTITNEITVNGTTFDSAQISNAFEQTEAATNTSLIEEIQDQLDGTESGITLKQPTINNGITVNGEDYTSQELEDAILQTEANGNTVDINIIQFQLDGTTSTVTLTEPTIEKPDIVDHLSIGNEQLTQSQLRALKEHEDQDNLGSYVNFYAVDVAEANHDRAIDILFTASKNTPKTGTFIYNIDSDTNSSFHSSPATGWYDFYHSTGVIWKYQMDGDANNLKIFYCTYQQDITSKTIWHDGIIYTVPHFKYCEFVTFEQYNDNFTGAHTCKLESEKQRDNIKPGQLMYATGETNSLQDNGLWEKIPVVAITGSTTQFFGVHLQDIPDNQFIPVEGKLIENDGNRHWIGCHGNMQALAIADDYTVGDVLIPRDDGKFEKATSRPDWRIRTAYCLETKSFTDDGLLAIEL